MTRYVLHPGWVTSKFDGDRHFIEGPTLARLYGVNILDCVFIDELQYREQEGDIHLFPQYSGDYTLPKTKE